MGQATLHLYSDGWDFFSAESAEEARELWVDQIDHDHSDGSRGERLVLVPDDKTFECGLDKRGELTEIGETPVRSVKRTAAEWAAHFGKGFAFTTEH
jgi:hypothetical protein